MHPTISEFPRRIFYDGQLFDGHNVKHPEYGNPLKREVFRKFPAFQVSRSWIEAAGFFPIPFIVSHFANHSSENQ